MPTLQNGQLLPKDEIFQDEIPAAPKDAYECSDPQAKQVEHATGLYTISLEDRCKLLILRSARVLARDNIEVDTVLLEHQLEPKLKLP